ncbi:MAG: cation diffusion facilitator family transporter [Microthrixaceae bacterium]
MTRSQRLGVALALNLALVAGQVVFGSIAGSVGLLADAAHNLGDGAAVVIALIAVRLSRRPPTPEHSYGYHRATILAALANAVALLVVTAIIVFEAVPRLSDPQPVRAGIVVVVALTATAINLAAAFVLYEKRVDLNMRSALLHMAADAGASLGVAAAGLVILVTGRFLWLDPAISIAIAVLIALEAWKLVRSAVDVLLEATPDDIDLTTLSAAMAGVVGVAGVHDLHVWSLSSGIRALSAHLVIDGRPSLEHAETIGRAVKAAIRDEFSIAHATLELEISGPDGTATDCESDIERHLPG